MIWLTWKLVTLPVRVVFRVLGLSVRTIRFLGIGRILAFAAGVGTGLAVAPTSGRELRAVLRERQQSLAATGGDLAAVVRHELANSPRTWHLPQPTVNVDEGRRVVLTGVVPHEDARHDLLRTAGAVAGVRAVDDHLSVLPPPEREP